MGSAYSSSVRACRRRYRWRATSLTLGCGWRILRRHQDGRHRRAGFLDQLHRLLVHAHDGTIRIGGFLIQIQDLFHVRHKLGIGLRRDHPVLDFIRTPYEMEQGLADTILGTDTRRSPRAFVT